MLLFSVDLDIRNLKIYDNMGLDIPYLLLNTIPPSNVVKRYKLATRSKS